MNDEQYGKFLDVLQSEIDRHSGDDPQTRFRMVYDKLFMMFQFTMKSASSNVSERNRELFDKYHEISLASTQMGIEIGKGMQEQARTRRLAVRSESTGMNPIEISAPRYLDTGPGIPPPPTNAQNDENRDGDNSGPATDGHPV